jgi:hypothetical protein
MMKKYTTQIGTAKWSDLRPTHKAAKHMAEHDHTRQYPTSAINGIKSVNRQSTPHIPMSKTTFF